jgi:hypothetical protein
MRSKRKSKVNGIRFLNTCKSEVRTSGEMRPMKRLIYAQRAMWPAQQKAVKGKRNVSSAP